MALADSRFVWLPSGSSCVLSHAV